MIYALHGITLALLGLNLLAYHAVELEVKHLKLLLFVSEYEALLKAVLMLGAAFCAREWVLLHLYAWIQLEAWQNVQIGELWLFRCSIEVLFALMGASAAAVVADSLIWVLELIYHRLSMIFIKMTGLNLATFKTEYKREVNVNAIPPTVAGSGGGGGRSPSRTAQEAIAAMEAAKQKAAQAAAVTASDEVSNKTPKARAISTKM